MSGDIEGRLRRLLERQGEGWNAGIVLREPRGRVLFLKRSPTSYDHPDTWCWPGGTAEPGETAEATARRETMEETGHHVDGPLRLIDLRGRFATFLADVAEEFEPALNEEHTDAHWTEPHDLRLIAGGGRSMHPGTLATLLDGLVPEGATMAADRAMLRRECLALDRASDRRIDPQSGHLHVAVSNISKATVNPYHGHEVPGWEGLKLDPDKVYQIFRPPEELEKGAPTYAGKPIVIIHKGMNADEHDREVVVGSVGSNVRFEAPYLKADLSIWDGEAIAGIESDAQRELSCGYAYDPVVESGAYEGQPYDLRMTNIRGNHIALVEQGRAGPDVLVGDQKPKEKPMKLQTKALPSRKALLLQGAISGALVGKLAADAKIDLTLALDGVTRTNLKSKMPSIKTGLEKALKGKLAQDEDLGEVVETVAELIDNLKDVQSGEDDEDDISGMDEDETEEEKAAREKKAEDEAAEAKKAMDEEAEAKKKAEDEAAEAGKKDGEKAMDAKLANVRAETRRDTIRELNAISEAKRAVRPIVGDLDGDFESAAAIHKFALDAAIERGIDIDLTGVPATAYGALVKMAVSQIAAEPKAKTPQAHDAKGIAAANEMFPGLARIKIA